MKCNFNAKNKLWFIFYITFNKLKIHSISKQRDHCVYFVLEPLNSALCAVFSYVLKLARLGANLTACSRDTVSSGRNRRGSGEEKNTPPATTKNHNCNRILFEKILIKLWKQVTIQHRSNNCPTRPEMTTFEQRTWNRGFVNCLNWQVSATSVRCYICVRLSLTKSVVTNVIIILNTWLCVLMFIN